MAPLLSTIGNKVYGFASSVIRSITDNFNRTTTGSLGISSSGSLWQAIRGTWYATGTTAKSDDVASNNSIAAAQLGLQNVRLSANVTSGTGLVFWLTDANSWWAAVPYDTSTSTCPNGNCSGSQTLTGNRSCSCYNTTCTYGCSCYNTTCTRNCSCSTVSATCTVNCSCTSFDQYGFTAQSCGLYEGYYLGNGACRFYQSNCYSYACSGTEQQDCSYQSSNCNNGSCSGTEQYSCQASTCNNGACSGTESRSCSQSTCNNGACSGTENYNYDQSCSCTYNYYLRLIKSVGGAVSTAGADFALTSAAASMLVYTMDNTISIKGYSGANLTGTEGVKIFDATTSNPVRGTSVGIIKTQSGYNQGSTIDSFSAEREL